jgi:hypothetical protein
MVKVLLLLHFLDLCDHLLKIKFFNFLLEERESNLFCS